MFEEVTTTRAADAGAETSARAAVVERPLPAALLEILALLGQGAPQSDDWSDLATLVAGVLEADFCCVVVRDRGARDRLRISATVKSGPLSIAARRALIRGSSVIRQLLAEEGPQAPNPQQPLRESRGQRHALTVPVAVDGAVASVLHLRRDGPAARAFSDRHADGARLVAALIGNALHLGRLQGLLRSNYAQLALVHGGGSGTRSTLAPVPLADAEGMALRLARSFYGELRNAGFNERQIIAAAGEVLALLSQDLRQRQAGRNVVEGGAARPG
jgi:GAF domain